MAQGTHDLSTARRRTWGGATAPDAVEAAANVAGAARQGGGEITTALVERISRDGVATVTVNGEGVPTEASSLVHYPTAAEASDALLGRTVLVLLTRNRSPVILGAVTQRVWGGREAGPLLEAQGRLPAGQPVSVQLDRRQRLDLEASEEIRLTCGKSLLVLRRDGTVIIRGVKLVSRATQSNKIRGATVNIN
jgi:hypothetical protein